MGLSCIVRLESSKRGTDPLSSRFTRPFSDPRAPDGLWAAPSAATGGGSAHAAARAPEAVPSILLKPANLTALPESVAAAERRKAIGGAAVAVVVAAVGIAANLAALKHVLKAAGITWPGADAEVPDAAAPDES